MVSVELQSGKKKGDENFPVGSYLIRSSLRPSVMAYYRFARIADDIADHESLATDEKIYRLNKMEEVLKGTNDEMFSPSAAALRKVLHKAEIELDVALDLLVAFRQDSNKFRYNSWEELLRYCRFSANPVGRFLLALHGEKYAARTASDALCTVLQIINHLQDSALDKKRLDRVYWPAVWFKEYGVTPTDLEQKASSPGLRRLLSAVLEATAPIMKEALELPAKIVDRRLRLETGVTLRLAEELLKTLAVKDPIAERVVLTKPRIIFTTLAAVPRYW